MTSFDLDLGSCWIPAGIFGNGRKEEEKIFFFFFFWSWCHFFFPITPIGIGRSSRSSSLGNQGIPFGDLLEAIRERGCHAASRGKWTWWKLEKFRTTVGFSSVSLPTATTTASAAASAAAVATTTTASLLSSSRKSGKDPPKVLSDATSGFPWNRLLRGSWRDKGDCWDLLSRSWKKIKREHLLCCRWDPE